MGEVRVAVTGALGVNGVFVIRSLLSRGVSVLATSHRHDFSLARDLVDLVEFSRVDVTRYEELLEPFERFKPDLIIHLAAILPVEAQHDPHRGFEVNAMGTANVLKVAREVGVTRVVFTSSKAAYGEVRGRHAHPWYEPISENDRCHPWAVYDFTKLASEGIGENYARTGGPEFVSLRFATIFGPGKVGKHGPMSIASAIVENAVNGVKTDILQGADQQDDYIYAVDAADAIVDVTLFPNELEHTVYNIGSGRGTSLGEYADIVRSFVPDAEIEIGSGLDHMNFGVSYYSVFDCTRALEFGFTPPEVRSGIGSFVKELEKERDLS